MIIIQKLKLNTEFYKAYSNCIFLINHEEDFYLAQSKLIKVSYTGCFCTNAWSDLKHYDKI